MGTHPAIPLPPDDDAPPGSPNLPIPMSSAEAFAALDHAHQQLVASEVAELVALTHAADLYELNTQHVLDGMEKVICGGHDGTPLVGEFIGLEVSALLGITAFAALGRISDALDLRHRFPLLWETVICGQVRVWQANRITELTSQLSADAAAIIDGKVAKWLPRQGFSRVMSLLPGWIDAADPQAARERAAEAAQDRRVCLSGIEDGHVNLWGKLRPADGIAFDHALTQIAQALPEQHCDAGEDIDVRRAAAVGILARQAHGQDLLPVTTLIVHLNANDPALNDLANDDPTTTTGTADSADPAGLVASGGTAGAAGMAGSTAGAAGMAGNAGRTGFALDDDQTGPACPPAGIATVERWGHLLTTQLPEFLAGSKVIVRPIIDPTTITAVDGYEVPDRMRFVLEQRNPVDVFPYGTRPARSCDIDHTNPYVAGVPGQTGLHNTGPLSRFSHRGKTHGGWHLQQPTPGCYLWTSPAGYRYLVTAGGTTRIHRPLSQRV